MKLTTIAAAAALAVASMSASAATYVPGTYTYKVNAHNAAMTIAVTVSKHRIEKIDWSKNLETIGVGQLALEKVGGRILEKQSLGARAPRSARWRSSTPWANASSRPRFPPRTSRT